MQSVACRPDSAAATRANQNRRRACGGDIDGAERCSKRTHHPLRALSRLYTCLLAGTVLAGCATLTRLPSPLPQYPNASPAGFPTSIRWNGEMSQQQFKAWAAAHIDGIERAAHGGPVNILVLSGGGGAGAFGAGILVGWTRRGTRPTFQIVTGVSVGALIAPFAFLGPKWDTRLSEAFNGMTAHPLLRYRFLGWLSGLFGWSVFQGGPLHSRVDRFVTPQLLRAVARQSAKGRLLLVATTNLDSEQVVVWNMGAIAAQGGARALKLFRRVLIASASIPGFFPPMLIPVQAAGKHFDELYVDGSTSASILFAPEIVAVLPTHLAPFHGAHVYLVVNGQLREKPTTVSTRTIPILERSLGTTLSSDARARVELAYSFARRHHMHLEVTEIPVSYPLGGLVSGLDPSRMKTLFQYGERCAAEGRIWGRPLAVLNRLAEAPHALPLDEVRCPEPDATLTAR